MKLKSILYKKEQDELVDKIINILGSGILRKLGYTCTFFIII